MPFNHKGEFIRSERPAPPSPEPPPSPASQPRPAAQPIPTPWLETLRRRRNLVLTLKILGGVAVAAGVIWFLVTFCIWILLALMLWGGAMSQ